MTTGCERCERGLWMTLRRRGVGLASNSSQIGDEVEDNVGR